MAIGPVHPEGVTVTAPTFSGKRMELALGVLHLLLATWLCSAQSAMSADKPTGVIKGRVTYVETGAPAAGVPLQAQGRAGNTVYGTHRATTDEDGHYSLDGLRAAEYRVQLSTQHTIEWTTLGKKGIKLAAGETKDGVNLVLIKGGIICGKVVEAGTGEPVAGASVCASASGALHLATTGADGSFRLRCPPGAYMACPMWVPKGYSRPERLGWRPATVREGRGIIAFYFVKEFIGRGVKIAFFCEKEI